MLSRVDERIGLKTPQQPILRKGAKTDKAQALSDDYQNQKSKKLSLMPCIGDFFKITYI